MKKIMIPLLALLLLVGGGGGAYFYMGTSEASVGGEEAVAEAPADAEEGAEAVYVKMDPIILPIIDREGISQTISMVISLQVNGKEKASEIESELPKLADAFLSDMYGTLSKKASMEGGVIKVSMLKARLSEITDRVLGKGATQGVLLQVLQQHPT